MNCARADCGKPATKRPVLSFAAKVLPHGPRARGELGIGLCDQHAVADPAEFVTDEGWAQICAGMAAMGRAEPDRDTLRIEFEAIQ